MAHKLEEPIHCIKALGPGVATRIAKMCDSKFVAWGARISAESDTGVRFHIRTSVVISH